MARGAIANSHAVTATSSQHLSELQTRAPPRALLRSSDAPVALFCCCSIHLELSTCWHLTVRKYSHFQTPLENPSVQSHLVLMCCLKRLCIFRPKDTMQIHYYYYYESYCPSLLSALLVTRLGYCLQPGTVFKRATPRFPGSVRPPKWCTSIPQCSSSADQYACVPHTHTIDFLVLLCLYP